MMCDGHDCVDGRSEGKPDRDLDGGSKGMDEGERKGTRVEVDSVRQVGVMNEVKFQFDPVCTPLFLLKIFASLGQTDSSTTSFCGPFPLDCQDLVPAAIRVQILQIVKNQSAQRGISTYTVKWKILGSKD
jgi:hypothetical protein